jgi:hypothetical protein
MRRADASRRRYRNGRQAAVPTAHGCRLGVWTAAACEHAFVTSQGHAHARFRRALLSKNLKLIEAASRELQHVGLDDALRVLVVFAASRDARYERAATRFAARVMLERRLGLAEARYVLALAEALPRSPDTVALMLRPYCG